MSLAEKIRKSRESKVPVGGFSFTIRRPTDVDMANLAGRGSVARLFPFIVGWEGVRELDLIPGGDPHPQPFDPEACAEWLADRPDLVGPLVDAILGSYDAHAKALEDARKN